VSSINSRLRILDAALALITRRGDASVTMAEIARAARVSRQAVYLHYADRAELLLALVRHLDDKLELPAHIQRIRQAGSGVAAIEAMVRLQVRLNPSIWAVARAFDAVRRTDPAAERSWQDRLSHRLHGCRAVIARLKAEGRLRRGVRPDEAADMLWAFTSLRTWEDFVLERRWSAARYQKWITAVLLEALTKGRSSGLTVRAGLRRPGRGRRAARAAARR
jgi:AcrR family transcriptional regulator